MREALQKYLDTANRAADAGAEILQQHFAGRVSYETKAESYNLVTAADVASEQAVVQVIRQRFPTHQVLAEEAGLSISDLAALDQLWVIDPLDGTNNFVHGIEHFAISVALLQRGRPIVGVVLNPITGERFQATAATRSQRNGDPIRVSSVTQLDQMLVGVGFYYDRDLMMRKTLDAIEHLFLRNIHGIRRLGTASLDLCNVACGRFGAYFEYELAPWDFAAGWLIVEQAGGRMTTAANQPLHLKHTSLLASNGHVHDAAADITARFHPQPTQPTDANPTK